jgi:hypothetical protein
MPLDRIGSPIERTGEAGPENHDLADRSFFFPRNLERGKAQVRCDGQASLGGGCNDFLGVVTVNACFQASHVFLVLFWVKYGIALDPKAAYCQGAGFRA